MSNALHKLSRRNLYLITSGAIVAGVSSASPALSQVQKADRASGGDWLAQIKAHHRLLERAFAEVKAANSAAARIQAQKSLATILMGHAIAEEAVIYPGMAMAGLKSDADEAYKEQVQVKIDMAALDAIQDKMSAAYTTKLGTIQQAVADHMKQEEGNWFPALMQKVSAQQNAKMAEMYMMEYQRYQT